MSLLSVLSFLLEPLYSSVTIQSNSMGLILILTWVSDVSNVLNMVPHIAKPIETLWYGLHKAIIAGLLRTLHSIYIYNKSLSFGSSIMSMHKNT